jgi:hypothetical protein
MDIKIEIKFEAVATIAVPFDELDSENYNLNDAEELDEAIAQWVTDNAMPAVRYPDYSGKNSYVCLPEISKVEWAVPDQPCETLTVERVDAENPEYESSTIITHRGSI